jgi:hypothetical protein
MSNLYNNGLNITTGQDVYDSFNKFIFSNDRNVFNKMMARINFYERTKDLHGDIVECGVFKGSGMLTWLKAMDSYEHHSIKKVVGFDMFDPEKTVEDLTGIDKKTMQQVFHRDNKLKSSDLSIEVVNAKILDAGFDCSKFELVEGDICEMAPDYINTRPGFCISILYMDLDLEEPTYAALNALWPRVVPGGIVVFDEYAYHRWSETRAADKFVYATGLNLNKLNIKAPTAYIVK